MNEGLDQYQRLIDGGYPQADADAWREEETAKLQGAGFAPSEIDSYWGAQPKSAQLSEAQKGWLGTTGVGRVLDAFKSGFAQPFHDGNLGLSPQSTDWLRKVGTFPSDERKVGPLTYAIESFNEAMMVPAARDLDALWRSVQSPFTGLAQGIGQVSEETGLATSLGYYPNYQHVGSQANDVATDILGAIDTLGLITGVHMEMPTTVVASKYARREPLAHPDEPVPPPGGIFSGFFKSEYGGGPYERGEKPVTFTTAKGSTYEVHNDGTTTRDKAARSDLGHEGQSGPQPRSERTFYVDEEGADKLSLFQTQGQGKMAVQMRGDQAAVKFLEGQNAGKFSKNSLTDIQTRPALGLIPVETWNDGTRVHFGNKITEVSGGEPRPSVDLPTEPPRPPPDTPPLRPDQPPGPRKAGNINLDRINAPEDVKAVLEDTARSNDDFVTARRGRMTFQDMSDLADAMGMSPADLTKRKVGQAFNAEQAVAARNILVASAEKLRDLAKKARGGTDEDMTAYLQAETRHAAIQEHVAGMTAEAGRALASFNIKSEATERAKQLTGILEQSGGRDNIQARIDAINSLDTPEQVSRFIADSRKATTMDKIVEAWINGLLSGPKTHVANALGNTLTAVNSVIETKIAEGIGKLHGGEKVVPGEAGARAFAAIQGAKDGVIAARRSWVDGMTAGKVEARKGAAIGGKAGQVIRVPTRALTASDAFFKAIARRQELSQLAYRQAATGGLTGDALAQRVADLVDSPSAKMIEKADAAADYQTFQKPLGDMGKAVQKFFAAHPVMKFVAPFIRTPIDIVKYAGERTPLSLFSKEVRDNLAGKNGNIARDTQASRLALGTAVVTSAFALAAGGLMTGGGPKDSNARNILYMTGWQPYSVRIGDTFYSYSRLDPFATLMGAAADAYEIQHTLSETDASDIGGLLLASASRNLLNKTWLQGPADLMQAVQDPDRYGAAWVRGLTSSFVPTIVADTARASDPYVRDARTIVDAFKARIPGLSQTLPVKNDLWGNPIQREGSVGPDMLSPIYQTSVKNDVIAREMLRVGLWKPAVSRDIRGVDLSADQYDQYQKVAGKLTRFMLDAVVGKPGWNYLPAERQYEIMDKAFNSARETARNYVTVKNTDLMKAVISKRIEQITGTPPKSGVVVPPAVQ
jgi:hypothetical protein